MRNLLYLLFVFLPACSEITQISDSGYGAFESDLEVLDDDTVAIAWYDTRNLHAEIYLRLLDRQLQPISAEFRLSENAVESYEVDIAALGKNIAATWYELDSSKHGVVKLGLWNRQGQQLWLKTLSGTDVNARIPVIEAVGNELFVAWLQSAAGGNAQVDSAAVVAVWVDASGANKSEPFAVAAASTTTWNLNVSIKTDEGSPTVFLVYDAQHETHASELYLARISDNEIQVNRLTDDDGYASKYPDVAIRHNTMALTWFDNLFGNNEIYVTVRDLSEMSSPQLIGNLELGAFRISKTTGDSIGSYLAWNQAVLGLAWSDSSGDKYDVYFQSLDVSGKPNSEIQQLTRSQADSLIPSISSLASGFVISWNEVTVNAHNEASRLSRSEIVAMLAY